MGLLERIFPSWRRYQTVAQSFPLRFDWSVDDPFAEEWIVTRRDALEIPGVARAHHMIVSKMAQLELVADNGSGPDATQQPTCLARTDTEEPPEIRMWCTADDLYFYGRALWIVVRGSFGQPLMFRWLPADRWGVYADEGVVYIDDQPADPSTYILFNMPMWSGILEMGRRTLKGARDIERAWTARMRSPVNVVELQLSEDANLKQEEADGYVKAWQKKHYSGAPAVGMSPPGVKLVTHQNSLGPADLFLQARDSIRTDIGSHSSLDGGMVDSTGGASSLTYETREGQRGDFYEFDLPFWTLPITARLSMDDVVPRGWRVVARFRPVIAPAQTAVDSEQVRYAVPGAPTAAPDDSPAETEVASEQEADTAAA